MIVLPRLYAILDSACFPEPDDLGRAAEELVAGGVTILQYRNKSGNAREMAQQARVLKQRIGNHCKLIMNDRADLCLAAGWDGVHLGQDDLSAEGARKVIGHSLWLGLSTHNPEQLSTADKTSADYLAVGPVFPTSSKERPDPVIGLQGVRRITRGNCRQVIEAGADAVAVISDLLQAPRKSAEEFFRVLR
jgi:thiamine-phosphate pyrophosphorylase